MLISIDGSDTDATRVGILNLSLSVHIFVQLLSPFYWKILRSFSFLRTPDAQLSKWRDASVFQAGGARRCSSNLPNFNVGSIWFAVYSAARPEQMYCKCSGSDRSTAKRNGSYVHPVGLCISDWNPTNCYSCRCLLLPKMWLSCALRVEKLSKEHEIK